MAAPNAAILKKKAADVIDGFSSELHELNKKIWKNPELAYEEKFSHDLLTDFLEEQGFSLKRHYSLETAFRATVDHDANKPTVGVICEYDALPEIGHACGHNLIAEAGVAAAIGETVELEYQFSPFPPRQFHRFFVCKWENFVAILLSAHRNSIMCDFLWFWDQKALTQSY